MYCGCTCPIKLLHDIFECRVFLMLLQTLLLTFVNKYILGYVFSSLTAAGSPTFSSRAAFTRKHEFWTWTWFWDDWERIESETLRCTGTSKPDPTSDPSQYGLDTEWFLYSCGKVAYVYTLFCIHRCGQ